MASAKMHQPNGHKKVERIGDYAFAPSALEEVHLPKSCRTVGKGAFFQVESATAFEGTARGLISALEAVIPGDGEKLPNLCWHEVRIRMISRSGDTEEIWIPQSLKRASAARIDTAWNSIPFDHEEYESCFADIQESDEKLEFASLAARRIGDITGTEYEDYFRRSGKRIAEKLIERREEKGLINLLKKDYFSESILDRLLKKCNEANMTTAAAYILAKKEKYGSKKRKTKAIRL